MAHRILVVDDDILVLDALRELLVADGYEVLTATRGHEALEILEHEHIDLVVLDVIMPKMTGFDVCRQIRARQDEKRGTKIIMLTAKTDPRDQEIGKEAGSDLYLTKPIDPGELKELVRTTLGNPAR
jgi:DNA-binding response OmpR family regulator